jgi:HopA1 effector protein family
MIPQILDFSQIANLDLEKLQDALQDIVHNVHIESDFGIRHPDYKPLEIPTEIINNFRQMSVEVQNRFVSLQLRSFLYGIYYNGSLQKALSLEGESSNVKLHQDLENTSSFGVDLAFYERLHNHNHSQGYFDPGWQVVKEESDGSLAVVKGGLRLHIDRDRHLQSSEKSASVGDFVAILLPKNRVQNGFYLAISNLGIHNLTTAHQKLETVRIYFNLTPDGAVAVMGSLTQLLNNISIPFTFKALYNPSDYGRHDSAVLYFEKNYYQQVQAVLEQAYIENQSYFQSAIPLFSKFIAPGLGLAEEPDQKFATQESFGMNRCQIIANALLEAHQKGKNSPEEKMQRILEHFSLLGITLEKSYLNANSEDIYQSLTLCK